MKKIVRPPALSPPRGDYSHGIVVSAGRFLFIAGQTAVGKEGQIVGVGDIDAQARQVYENIGAILAEAGMTFANLVKMTTFVTDVSFRGKVSEVRRQYLQGDFPANTLVVVKGLAEAEYLLEIEAVAWTEGQP